MVGVLWGLKENAAGNETLSLTAYLSTLKNLDEEFPKLVNTYCTGVPPMDTSQIKFEHPSSSDPYNFYHAARTSWARSNSNNSSEDGVSTSRALCAIHMLDYACYEDIPIPHVCQSVYDDEQFVTHLIYAADQ